MAGSEKAGVEAGRLKLFKDRPWIATPEKSTHPEALAKVQQLALLSNCYRMRIVGCSPY